MTEAADAGTAASPAVGCIKGTSIREFVRWWGEHHGIEQLQTKAKALEPMDRMGHLRADREAMGLLPSVWYPAELVHALVDALLEDVPPGEHKALADRAGDECMDRILRGVYRMLFSLFASPDRYHQYASRLWTMHYDTGYIENETIGESDRLMIVRDWAGHHPFICLLNTSASRALHRAMGCKDPKVQLDSCVSRGSDACRIHIVW